MICARCGEPTVSTPCTECGADPLLDGRYALLAELGRGRFATTWKATDPDGNPVAIKEVQLTRNDPYKLRELLQREARVLRELDHPRIPAWLDDFTVKDGRHRSFCLVQQYVSGQTLAAEAAARRYTPDEVLDVIETLAAVLTYLHGLSPPVVHRDLKPANVLRREDGELVLLDFGSVRDALEDSQLGGSTVTGTFGYMAPEQFAGSAKPRTDVYGLGALAVSLLSRQDPHSLLDGQRLDWRKGVRVGPGLAGLLDAMLQSDPSLRPTAAEVAGIVRTLRHRKETPVPLPVPVPAPEPVGTRTAERTADDSVVEALLEPEQEDALPGPAANNPLVAPAVTAGGEATRFLALVIGMGFAAALIVPVVLAAILINSEPRSRTVSEPPPIREQVPVDVCTPSVRETQGDDGDPRTTDYELLAASKDGSKVAVRFTGVSDRLFVYKAGEREPLIERSLSGLSPAPDGIRGHADRVTYRTDDMGPEYLPKQAASWCEQDGRVQLEGRQLTFEHTFEACEGAPDRFKTQFAVCDRDDCITAPELDFCWSDPPRLLDTFVIGEYTWFVAERPMSSGTPRFMAGGKL